MFFSKVTLVKPHNHTQPSGFVHLTQAFCELTYLTTVVYSFIRFKHDFAGSVAVMIRPRAAMKSAVS